MRVVTFANCSTRTKKDVCDAKAMAEIEFSVSKAIELEIIIESIIYSKQ